jgi:hypothetical protein
MMRARYLTCVYGAVFAAAAAWQTASLVSQSPTTAKAWTVPRTAWGDPDLHGVWTNFNDTPLQQPHPDPAIAATERAVEQLRFGGEGNKVQYGGSDNSPRPWNLNDSPQSPKRPSLIVDPPNGRLPVKKLVFRTYEHLGDSWEYHSSRERCITRGVPGGLMPEAYNNGYEIFQIPGFVVIRTEMIHNARVIPMDGRPHVSPKIRLWDGDSRGRWEGTTLVVDTTNFNDKGQVVHEAAISIPQSETLHVVERFTPVDANTINYEVTVEDPTFFTQPWKMAYPLNRHSAYRLYEYACHEGNRRFMERSLKVGRAADRAVEAAKK